MIQVSRAQAGSVSSDIDHDIDELTNHGMQDKDSLDPSIGVIVGVKPGFSDDCVINRKLATSSPKLVKEMIYGQAAHEPLYG